MSRSRRVASLGLVIVAQSLVLPGARAADPVFTDAWEGVWDVDFVERECGSGDTTPFNGPSRMCSGEPARFNQGLAYPYVCDGVVTDDSMEMTCTWEIEPFPGCTAMYDYTLSAVRVGDVLAGTEDFELTFVGDCVDVQPYCSQTEFDGARTALDPMCKDVPVAPASWTTIKSVYR